MMGESEISARLRRLREEGEEASAWKPFSIPIQRPAGAHTREADFRSVEVLTEVVIDTPVGFKVEERVSSTMADANAGPFENIVHRGWVRRKGEDAEIAEIRTKTGIRFRSIYEGAQIGPLKGQSYEGGGSGGGMPRPVADHAIDCQKYLGSLRDRVPADVFTAVVDVVCRDIWIWEGRSGGAIAKEVDRVLRGLDHMAVAFGYLTIDTVEQRWPTTPPRRAKAGGEPPAPAAS